MRFLLRHVRGDCRSRAGASPQDSLNGLIDEGRLREQLVMFSFSRESGVVQPEHRAGLVPIVARIAYALSSPSVPLPLGQALFPTLVVRCICVRGMASTGARAHALVQRNGCR